MDRPQVAISSARARFGLGPNWANATPLTNSSTDEEIDAEVEQGFAATPQIEQTIGELQDLKREQAARLHLIIWGPPRLPGEQAWPSEGAKERSLPHSDVGLFARFDAAVLRSLKHRGLDLDAVELTNEPDGLWNLQIDPADYLQLVKLVRIEAQRRQFSLPPIYGPGASTIAATRTFFADPSLGRALLDSIDVLSTHAYDPISGPNSSATELDALWSTVNSLGRQPKIAVTEFAVVRPDPNDNSARMNAKNRRPDSVALTEIYAAATVEGLISLFKHHVGTVIYWEFQDQPWENQDLALVTPEGRHKPVYDAVSTFSRTLNTSAASIIEIGDDPRTLVLRNADRIFLVGSNPQNLPQDINFVDINPRTTEQSPILKSASGRFSVRVPPFGIFSIPMTRY